MTERPRKDRQSRLFQSPEIMRRGYLLLAATIALVYLYFGVELLHKAAMDPGGVSMFTPLIRFMKESTALRLIVLLLWGYFLFDFSLLGGMVLVSAPFHRFIRHLDEIPGRLLPFQIRADDHEFVQMAEAYNLMVQRIAATRGEIFRILDEAAARNAPAVDAREQIRIFLSSRTT